MTLGVAHPMGPLALLDLVGLDVAVAIGQALNDESGNPDHLAPATVQEFVAAGIWAARAAAAFFTGWLTDGLRRPSEYEPALSHSN